MEKRTHVERVIVVLDDQGAVLSAQQVVIERVYDSEGDIYAERNLGTTAIEEDVLKGILNNPAILAQVKQLEEKVLTLKKEIEGLKESINEKDSLLSASKELAKQIVGTGE